jgi:hypothetical protein
MKEAAREAARSDTRPGQNASAVLPGPSATLSDAKAAPTGAATPQPHPLTGVPMPASPEISPPRPLELAPPLPPPVEVRRVPREPQSLRGISPQAPRTAPGMPLWLPGAAPPSVMDSLVGPRN